MATALFQQQISWDEAPASGSSCRIWFFASRVGAFPWLGRTHVPEIPVWIAAGKYLEEFYGSSDLLDSGSLTSCPVSIP